MHTHPSPGFDNGRALRAIEDHVARNARHYFPELDKVERIGRHAYELDYWSISAVISVTDNLACVRKAFVKMPKVNIRQHLIAEIALDTAARHSAQVEFASFSKIFGIGGWPHGCAPIRPLDYIEPLNALITAHVASKDLFRVCRAATLSTLMMRAPGPGVHGALLRCGRWLRHFHESCSSGETALVPVDDLFARIQEHADGISAELHGRTELNRMLDTLLSAPAPRCTLPVTCTAEGFELRNILVTSDNTVYLVDPGATTPGSGLEDISHFLMSQEMLFWGTLLLPVRLQALKGHRAAFLRGYFDSQPPPAVLRWFLVKEILRQWKEAYFIVRFKQGGPAVRAVLRRCYVDPFFFRVLHDSIFGDLCFVDAGEGDKCAS
jgi:hypothetical protein